MTRDPALLIGEYLDEPDHKVRRNAITALAAIATPASVARLADFAMRTGDAEIRAHAEEELAALDAALIRALESHMHAALRDPASAHRAYVLIGQLRSRGVDILLPANRPIRDRLGTVYETMEAEEKKGRRLGHALAGLTGGLVALILLGGYIFIVLGRDLDVVGGLFLTLLIATLLTPTIVAVFAADRARPIGVQPDRLAAAVREVSFAMLMGLVPIVIGLFAFELLIGQFSVTLFLFTVCTIAAAALFLAAIRLGTLVAHRAWKEIWWDRLGAALVGWCAGLLTITASLIVLRLVLGEGFAEVASYASAGWLLLAIAGAGVATAFSIVDRSRPVSVPYARRLARPVSGAIVGSTAALLLATGILADRAQLDHMNVAGVDVEDLRSTWTTAHLPSAMRMHVDSGSWIIDARADPPGDLDQDRELLLWGSRDSVPWRVGDDPEEIRLALDRGSYALQLRLYGTRDRAESREEAFEPEALSIGAVFPILAGVWPGGENWQPVDRGVRDRDPDDPANDLSGPITVSLAKAPADPTTDTAELASLASWHALHGRRPEGVRILQQIENAGALLSSDHYARFCWAVALDAGLLSARDTIRDEVLWACERAVALDSLSMFARSGRGVTHMRLGVLAGSGQQNGMDGVIDEVDRRAAIADLEFISRQFSGGGAGSERYFLSGDLPPWLDSDTIASWLRDLRENRDPFGDDNAVHLLRENMLAARMY